MNLSMVFHYGPHQSRLNQQSCVEELTIIQGSLLIDMQATQESSKEADAIIVLEYTPRLLP